MQKILDEKNKMNPIEILHKYNIFPKKSLGQNFLVNDEILDKIASYIDLENQNIIEIWPWYWALTEKILSKNPKSIELVELDKKMVEILNSRIKNNELKIPSNINFNIHNIDVLKFKPNFENYIVVANIPYYITSPILNHFLYNLPHKPKEMIILMQKDVADKIIKKQKDKTSVLSLVVDFMCKEISEITKVWASNFIPPPKVESKVLYFKIRKDINKEIIRDFLEIIKLWFSEKRKKLISNLSKRFDKNKLSEIFEKLEFNTNTRAEDISLDNWIRLTKSLKNNFFQKKVWLSRKTEYKQFAHFAQGGCTMKTKTHFKNQPKGRKRS